MDTILMRKIILFYPMLNLFNQVTSLNINYLDSKNGVQFVNKEKRFDRYQWVINDPRCIPPVVPSFQDCSRKMSTNFLQKVFRSIFNDNLL